MVSFISLTPPEAVDFLKAIFQHQPQNHPMIMLPFLSIELTRSEEVTYGLSNDYALVAQMGKRPLPFNRVLSAGVHKIAAPIHS